jgi:hypothetical protein
MDASSLSTSPLTAADLLWCVVGDDPGAVRRTWLTLVQRLGVGGVANPQVQIVTHWRDVDELTTRFANDVGITVIGTAMPGSYGALAASVSAARDHGASAVIVVPGDVVVDLRLASLVDLCASVGDDAIIPDDSRSSAFDDPGVALRSIGPPARFPMILGCRTSLNIEQRLVGPGGWHSVERAVAARGGVVRRAPQLVGVDVSAPDASSTAHPWHHHVRNDLIAGGPAIISVEAPVEAAVRAAVDAERASPWWWFDSIVGVNVTRHTQRRRLTQMRSDVQGFGHRLAWFPAVESSEHIPEAILLSHRAVIADAARRGVERLLILEDDVVFSTDVSARLGRAIEAVGDDWDLGYLGGIAAIDPSMSRLATDTGVLCGVPVGVFTTHAYAVHHRAFAMLLDSLPSTFEAATTFIAAHGPIDNWYADQMASGALVGWLAHPQIAVQADQLSRQRADLSPAEQARFRP